MQISRVKDIKGQQPLLDPGEELPPKPPLAITMKEFMKYYRRAKSRGQALFGKARKHNWYGELHPGEDGLINIEGRVSWRQSVRPEEIEWIKEEKARKL